MGRRVDKCDQGLTLVISPLIALMRDQVDVLVQRGGKAAALDSTQGLDRSTWIKDEVLNGNMKILFVAPERCVSLKLQGEALLMPLWLTSDSTMR